MPDGVHKFSLMEILVQPIFKMMSMTKRRINATFEHMRAKSPP